MKRQRKFPPIAARTIMTLVALMCWLGAAWAQEPVRFRPFHLEATSYDHMVGGGLGNWWGGGIELSWRSPGKATLFAGIQSERRPGDSERFGAFRAVMDLSKHLYADATVGWGGPDSAESFFPRYRFDWTMNLKVPRAPGLILFGGASRLQFGAPVRGDILRTGAILYWRKFVFQGNVNRNNSRPGNRVAHSYGGAAQYGQEGRFWIGASASRGHEAWQTLALRPQDVDFLGYGGSVFGRKWLAPGYGFAGSYSYSLKHTAYRVNGVEFKFFVEF